MNPAKIISVFGEEVHILVAGAETESRSTTVMQISPPGGGPPPHAHTLEDETFFVIEGEYEVTTNGNRHKLLPGQTLYSPRGDVHTFRNIGNTSGKMLVFVAPAGIERYLQELSQLSLPEDLLQLAALSERHGISYPNH